MQRRSTAKYRGNAGLFLIGPAGVIRCGQTSLDIPPISIRKRNMRKSSSKQLFGSAIARWFRQNDWPQKICERWSECDGKGVKGPWASQISQVVHGRLDPRTIFFDALGDFNEAIAEQDLTRIQQVDRDLYDRLRNGRPFLLSNDTPATASDFFSMFVGETLIPAFYQTGDFTDADFIFILETCNKNVERVCLECMMPKPDVLAYLKKHVFIPHGVFGEMLERLALKLEKPSAEQMVKLTESGEIDPTQGCPVLAALEKLLREKSGNTEKLNQLQADRKEVNDVLLTLAST